MFLINEVPVQCIIQAAEEYHLPVTLLISVLKTENGRIGLAKPNANGTYDYGPMQINTVWINKVRQYGYSQNDIQYNACINVNVGAWILAQEIADGDSLWQGVGNYHSHTLSENNAYGGKVNQIYYRINQELAR